MRTAAYARFSSDQQRDASLEDQLRNCRAYCDRQGWPVPVAYTDAAMSGSREDRPGYRSILRDASERQFDVLLVDDLSRLSRDSGECAKTVKRLAFAGIRLIGVSDGVDTARKSYKADVGLRGLMSELYLDDLADKTHRGLTGRALAGASAGGLPYGYRKTDVGQRAIDTVQADVVRRIFADYLAGHSPREIAMALNHDKIPAPRGGPWSHSAIRGDRKRGLGILVNPIYAGRQVWNRSKWIKHPDTGRRVRQERPQSEWIVTTHPQLGIIDPEVFEAAQRRMDAQSQQHPNQGRGRRPHYLLSGILRCGCCGTPMVVVDRYAYACMAYRDRGTCTSRLRVPRQAAEEALLAGIRDQLLTEQAFKTFLRAATAELKRATPVLDAARRNMAEAERVRCNILAALRAGIITPSTKAEMNAAENAVAAAEREMTHAKAYRAEAFLPRARDVWQRMVADLTDYAGKLPAAREALRELIGDAIPIHNQNGVPVAEITPSSLIAVVAGARCVRYQTRPFYIPIPRKAGRRL